MFLLFIVAVVVWPASAQVDECLSFPCAHGTCTDGVASYTCSCENGWTGTNCDQLPFAGDCYQFSTLAATHLDATQACSANSGRMVDRRDPQQQQFLANTIASSTGVSNWLAMKTAPLPILYSDGSPVLGGTPQFIWRFYSKLHTLKSSDRLCRGVIRKENNCIWDERISLQLQDQLTLKPCEPNVCQNGGNCTSCFGESTNFCDCLDGFEGLHCEIDTDECASNPCQHGGTCRDQVNSYSCRCPTGYDGDNCQVAEVHRRLGWMDTFRADNGYTVDASAVAVLRGVFDRIKTYSYRPVLTPRNTCFALECGNGEAGQGERRQEDTCNVRSTPLLAIDLTNARSLSNKLEEFELRLHDLHTGIAIGTETWFRENSPAEMTDIQGYTTFSRARAERSGGGVAVYVREDISSSALDIPVPEELKCTWVKVRPHRLPRNVSCLAVCAAYSPPDSPHRILMGGDFNRVDISRLCTSHNLRQLVDRPTTDQAILDLIITNLNSYYSTPIISDPLATSDHNTVIMQAKGTPVVNKMIKRVCRPFPHFGQWIMSHEWSELSSAHTTSEKSRAFYSTLQAMMDNFFPIKLIRLHTFDKPWITPAIKSLIQQRQFMKSMANSTRTEPDIHIDGLDPRDKVGTANAINKSLATVINSLSPKDLLSLPSYLPSLQPPTVSQWEVYKKLEQAKTRKAAGPDGIPGKLIKEFGPTGNGLVFYGDLSTRLDLPESDYPLQLPALQNTAIGLFLAYFCQVSAHLLTKELEATLACHSVQIACITETWTTPLIPDEVLSIEGFKLFRRDRQHGKGGELQSSDVTAKLIGGNKTQTIIKQAKFWYYRNFIQHLKQENPRKWWSFVNRELGRSQERSNRTSFENVPDHDVAEALNQHFSEMWCPGNDLYLFPLQQPTESVDLCSIGEVKALLKNVNPNKASGPDDLPTWILKEYADDFAPVITHLFNSSYEGGSVPGVWKAANVVPIPKVKGVTTPSDMRPVSLLPVLVKLLERCILKRLLPSITPVITNQYAYLKGSSTVIAVIRMVQTWLMALDSKDHTVVQALFADMSKAFDRVNHSILLQRVNDVVGSPRMVAWVQNYLTGRTQRVTANNNFSSWRQLTSGVPQGGVLSPYLFLLFMSSRDTVYTNTLDVGYADDVGLSRSVPLKQVGLDNTMTEEAAQLDSWAVRNDMLLNGKKSQLLLICSSRGVPTMPPLTLGGDLVPVTSVAKGLGFIFDSRLSWEEHVDAKSRTPTPRSAPTVRKLQPYKCSSASCPADMYCKEESGASFLCWAN
ncbi:hypothetical protein Bbelb_292880 [Branchiostoma belcheri]|nr:hypothetical protein Bbelb_292880 [Branchiostoma belcheri]